MKVLCLAPDRAKPDRITGMTFIDEELEAIVEAGVEVHVLSATAARREVIRGVHVRPVPGGRDARRILANLVFLTRRAPLRLLAHGLTSRVNLYHAAKLEAATARLIREEGFDIVHSHFGSPGGVGGRIGAAAGGVPLVGSLRGMDLLTDPELGYGLRLDGFYDSAVRELLRQADRTLYASEHMRQRGIQLGARPERAVVIRKGVRADLFEPGSAPKTHPPELLVVCNLLPRKRVDHLLRAAARAAASLKFTVTVCGSGPERASLEALAAELGIAERVTFAGWVERADMPALFARASLFVLPSVEEAAGNVLLEAQASGVPAVCMLSGGAPEYIRDGATGFVLDRSSVDQLADTIVRVLSDTGLQARLGAEARTFATGELNYDRMIGQMVDLYREVLDNSKLAPRRGSSVATTG